jgi:hypothetical protein
MTDILARQMPPVKHAKVNGIDMAYYEVGSRKGVPIILWNWPSPGAISYARSRRRACGRSRRISAAMA